MRSGSYLPYLKGKNRRESNFLVFDYYIHDQDGISQRQKILIFPDIPNIIPSTPRITAELGDTLRSETNTSVLHCHIPTWYHWTRY
jgi:hypothetical protein